MKKIIKETLAFAASIQFLCRNLWAARHIKPVTRQEQDGITFRGMIKEDEPAICALYAELNANAPLPWSRRLLYRLVGPRLMMVATDQQQNVVGMAMYYFNKRDRLEGTAHIGLTGISTKLQGKGLGTRIRIYGMDHLFKNGVTGISSRVSLTNIASLRSNEKLGFKPVEQYYDSTTKEQRYYLICSLASYQNRGTNE
ncbi:MAG TPA: GNAT family N-acetyltransferase [Eoetvoesiella sp.]